MSLDNKQKRKGRGEKDKAVLGLTDTIYFTVLLYTSSTHQTNYSRYAL